MNAVDLKLSETESSDAIAKKNPGKWKDPGKMGE